MASDPANDRVAHVEGLIRCFVRPDRRERYVALFKTAHGRQKVRLRLAHLADLDERAMVRIAPAEQTATGVLRLLRAAGATESCYAISERAELDDRLLSLSEAVERVVGNGFGTIISCLPGELAYFEGEDVRNRFLLRRRV